MTGTEVKKKTLDIIENLSAAEEKQVEVFTKGTTGTARSADLHEAYKAQVKLETLRLVRTLVKRIEA